MKWLSLFISVLSLLAVGSIGWQQMAYQKIQADALNRLERLERTRLDLLGKGMREDPYKADFKLLY